MRPVGLLAIGALTALAAVGPGFSAASAPEPMTPEPAPAATGRAHLVFRAEASAVLEGRVTVIERRSDRVVVEELRATCAADCAQRRLAMTAPRAPLPPVRE